MAPNACATLVPNSGQSNGAPSAIAASGSTTIARGSYSTAASSAASMASPTVSATTTARISPTKRTTSCAIGSRLNSPSSSPSAAPSTVPEGGKGASSRFRAV